MDSPIPLSLSVVWSNAVADVVVVVVTDVSSLLANSDAKLSKRNFLTLNILDANQR